MFSGLAALAILVFLVLIVFVPPDGAERSEFAQFLGRFHPLIIHLPIALLLLVPVLEVAGFSKKGTALRQSAEFVLGLATLSAIAAVSLGWLLARSGGYDGALVRHHMWGGISVAAASLGCFWIFERKRHLAILGLIATVGLTAWTSDQGGKLTYGADYWTEHMPAPVRKLLNVRESEPVVSVDPTSFYALRVQPVFAGKCASCHSADKHKGNLRLDSYENVMRGGKDGRVIQAGDLQKSELFRRITLPSDSKGFMPAEGKPALTADETKVIEVWIKAGATVQVDEKLLAGLPVLRSIDAPQPKVPDYRPQAQKIAALESALAIRLIPRSQDPTDGLILRTVSSPETCTDATLAQLAPIANLIVDAELARTKVTDNGISLLAKNFANLRFLDLSNTEVTSAGAKELARMSKLESLNMTSTRADTASIADLRSKPNLKKFYFFDTR
jgi:uncharacterized membrane protein